MTTHLKRFGLPLLVATLVLLVAPAKAQSIIDREYLETVSALPATDIIHITDDQLTLLTAGTSVGVFKDKEAYALVSLGIDPDLNLCYTEALKFKVTIKSEETVITTPGVINTYTNYYTLIVNYDPQLQQLEAENAFVKITGCRELKLSITDVRLVNPNGSEVSVTAPSLLPGDLYVEGEIIRERYYDFNPLLGTSIPSFFNPLPTEIESFLVTDHVHVVQWTNVPGAVEYELEWTYVNDYGTTAYNAPVLPTAPFSFKNNASSVRVKRSAGNRFFIPAIYGSGYVVFRVRAIGRGGPGLDEDVFGSWSLNAPSYTISTIISGSPASYRVSIPGNTSSSLIQEEYNLNAQFMVRFAEEGKMLVSGSFADGTLRARQNVSSVKVYDDQPYGKKAMITETIYDHMGRPAISTLPAVTKNGLWYTPNYNLDDATLEKFDYTHFDLDGFLQEGCISTASAMSPTSGASQYYSSSNLNKTEGHQGLIADAFKFPYSQILYEKDNSLRVNIQSGPGQNHKMGSGHESKSVYGSAEQVELNRLFGTDAGLATYYQKTMETDPNGQISVTYTDMLGHTVATALAGEVPPNTDALLDQYGNPLAQGGEEVTDDLLHKTPQTPNGTANTFSQDGTSYTYTGSILVSSKQVYHFSYSTQLKEFEDSCFLGKCMDCVYDLELAVIDDCGTYIIGNANLDGPLTMTLGNRELDMTCDEDSLFGPLNFSIELEVGAYSIYKKLSINEEAMEAYADSMLASSTCLLPPGGFYDTPDLTGCDITCEQCMESLGTWDDFFTQQRIDELGGDSVYAELILSQVYASMKSDCEAICADATRDYCAAAYELMLLDMSPQGQYAGYEDNGSSMSSADILSIFNPTNLLPKKFAPRFAVSSPVLSAIDNQIPTWRLPVHYDPMSPTPYKRGYYTDNGQRVTIHVYKNTNGDYVPAVLDPTQVTIVDEATNSYSTFPENLLNLNDFISVFQPHYAKSLLIWHPEFFHYEWCASTYQYTTTVDNEEVNTHNFDRKLANMNLAEAKTYFGAPAVSSISSLIGLFTANDPFFLNPLATVTLFPGINPTSILTNRLTAFENVYPIGGPIPYPVNFAQMAHVVGHCGLTGQCVSTSYGYDVWGSGSSATDLISTDDDWKRLVDYYTSTKQYMFGISQNLYALYGDDPLTFSQWPLVNTQCIGDNTYVPVNELLEWAANPSSLLLENPCNPLTFPFYHQKQRRFFQNASGAVSEEFGVSDPPTLEELQEYTQQAYYQQTGNCLIVGDLETMLSKLSAENKLTTAIPLDLGNGYLGSTLYNYIETNGNPAYLSYAAGISGNTLTALTSAVNCEHLFTLTLPPAAISAGYTFTDIIYLSSLNNIHNTGSGYTFEMQAILQQTGTAIAETLTVTGSTCLPLEGCASAFKNICKPTPESKDLMNLLSTLSQAGQLYGSGVNLNVSPYNLLITPRLKNYLGVGGNYTWTYGTTPAPYFELKNTVNANVIRLDVGSNALNPSLGYEFISVSSANTVTLTSSFNDFIFTATPIDPSDPNPYQAEAPGAVKVTMAGTASITIGGGSQSFPVTECNPVTPLECNTLEHKNLEALKEKWELVVATPALEDELNTNGCIIDVMLNGAPLDIADLAEILEVQADMALSDNGINSHYFNVKVRLTDNSIAYVTGKSCEPLRNCETCEDACDLAMFEISFPQGYIPVPHTKYFVRMDCADFEALVEYDHASVEEFWQEMADQINASTHAPYLTASVENQTLVATFPKDAASYCPCGTMYGALVFDIYTQSPEPGFDTRQRLATYTSQCCETQPDPCQAGTSYVEFTFDDSIPQGYRFYMQGNFVENCLAIDPPSFEYNHLSTNAFLGNWASEIAYYMGNTNPVVSGNTLRLYFAPGSISDCSCGTDKQIFVNVYDAQQEILWSETSSLLCCGTEPPTACDSSTVEISFPPSHSPDGWYRVYWECAGYETVIRYDGSAAPEIFWEDLAAQINSDIVLHQAPSASATAYIQNGVLKITYPNAEIPACPCGDAGSKIILEAGDMIKDAFDPKEQIAEFSPVCCDTSSCQPGSGSVVFSFDTASPQSGNQFSLGGIFLKNCVNIKYGSFTYNHAGMNDFLTEWAQEIAVNNPTLTTHVTANTLQITFAPGVFDTENCPCGNETIISVGQYDGMSITPLWSQESALTCCTAPTACQPGGSRIAYYYTGTGNPDQNAHELWLGGKFQNCFAITPGTIPYDGTQPIADVLADWATLINANHSGQVFASAAGNMLQLVYAPGTLTDCSCTGNTGGKLIEVDEQPNAIWEYNASLECCPGEVPASRPKRATARTTPQQKNGGVNRSEAEEETFNGWEPWPQFAENTDCHPDVVPFPTDTVPVNPCIEYLLQTAATAAQFDYAAYLAQKREEYKQMYREHCMQLIETFDVGYQTTQYHYTLYYYDRAGNLVKTVPPHAVVPLTGTTLASVNNARANNAVVVPVHNGPITGDPFKLTIRYRYNSINQPIAQQTPDGGVSAFWYDRLGRLVLSQDAEQAYTSAAGQYIFSYTRYDAMNRIIETGKMANLYNPTGQAYINQASTHNTFFLSGSFTATDVIQTKYDITAGTAFVQENLRTRVSYTRHKPKGQSSFTFTDYYTYDFHGNVKSVLHENLLIPAAPLQKNQVDYVYDLVDGKVNSVVYNAGKPDQYIHKYTYDAQNRLTHVYTSRNGLKYDLDARYFYYWHGPLARTELGQNKIQGLDYAYTIQGWRKSINSDALRVAQDPSHDGDNTLLNPNRYFARDAYGLSLHYSVNDYTPIESTYEQAPALPSGYRPNLWNGNIGALNNSIRHPEDFSELSLLQGFTHDQLNRITSGTAYHSLDIDNNLWAVTATPLAEYATTYKYDPAGNIKNLTRTGETGPMDDLTFHYPGFSNQLQQVTDNPAYDANYSVDIDNQLNTDNYHYDKVGNLTKDKHEEIETIEWNAYGKVVKVTRTSGSTKPDLEFMYDPEGRRIMKKIIPKADLPVKTEYYVHDAAGNVLSIYTYTEAHDEADATYKINEQLLYGNTRLGTWKSDLDLLSYIPAAPQIHNITRGQKQYELSNHQGNVQSVVSDRKNRICVDGVFLNYEADIRNTYDYYAFGMLMPERTYNAPVVGWEGCDTIQDSVLVLMYDVNFDNEVPSWTLFDDGHSWYLFSSENPTQTESGQLAMHHPQPNDNINTGYILADPGPVPPALVAGETYYYEFDIDMGDCNLDSLIFGINSLNNSNIQSYAISGSGHVSGNFTVAFNDNYLISLVLFGGDTCTAYMDNFKMWRYKDTSIVDCSGSTTYTTLFEDDFNINYHDYGWGNYYGVWALDGTTASSGGNMFSDETGMLTAKFFTTEAGQKYRITVVIPDELFDCSPALYITFGKTVQETHNITAPGTHTFEWIAPDADGAIIFNLSDCDILLVDNVLVQKVEETERPENGYRFGFNGKEKTDEAYGDANAYDFGDRIYNPRLGRWLSVDKLFREAPDWTPYRAFYDNPFCWIDLNGNIEWPLKGTMIEYSHMHNRIQRRHYVGGNKIIGHIAQHYDFAYQETDESKKHHGNLPRTPAQDAAADRGMLIKINSEWFRLRTEGTSPHIGVDFRASIGTDVYSFGNGEVVAVETSDKEGTGRYVVVKYANGDKVRFLHLSSIPEDIKVGTCVYEGQIIAKTGNSGGVPPHLHVDATSSEGKMVNPLERTYGTVTNKEFFEKFNGDWQKLKAENERIEKIRQKLSDFYEKFKPGYKKVY